MTIVERAKAPTPKFFRVLRSVGMALLAISGSIIAAPVVLPTIVVSVAGYAAVAGGVLSAVSQLTTETPIAPIPLAPEGGTELDSEEGQKNIRDGD